MMIFPVEYFDKILYLTCKSTYLKVSNIKIFIWKNLFFWKKSNTPYQRLESNEEVSPVLQERNRLPHSDPLFYVPTHLKKSNNI